MTTTEPLVTQDQGNLVSKLAGLAVGTFTTLTCIYNPSSIPYVVPSALCTVAAADIGRKNKLTNPGATGIAVASLLTVFNRDGFMTFGILAGSALVGAGTGVLLRETYGEENALSRLRRYTTSGFLAATLLMGGYLVGRDQTPIREIAPQKLEIKQPDGTTTSFRRQVDGTYTPLEQRLPK